MEKLRLSIVAALLCASFATWAGEPAASGGGSAKQESKRLVISLDGTWQIAEGKMDRAPATFDRTVPVPGLVSLAMPGFDAPGPKITNRLSIPQKDPKRDAFWYRRTFALDGPLPAVAKLKVAKAMFGRGSSSTERCSAIMCRVSRPDTSTRNPRSKPAATKS